MSDINYRAASAPFDFIDPLGLIMSLAHREQVLYFGLTVLWLFMIKFVF